MHKLSSIAPHFIIKYIVTLGKIFKKPMFLDLSGRTGSYYETSETGVMSANNINSLLQL